jgi:predicted flavoprotein YhiN
LLKDVKLSLVQVGLLKKYLNKETYLNPELLAHHIKNLSILVTGSGLLNDAISTTGGIQLHAVDENFQLKKNNSIVLAKCSTGMHQLVDIFSRLAFSMGMHLARH